MNPQDLLTKPLESIEFKDRMQLCGALLADLPIKHVDTETGIGMMLFSADDVRPGEVRSIPVRGLLSFKPTRLVFLEQEREIVNTRRTDRTTTRGFWLWPKTTTEIKTDHVSRLVRTSSGAWSAHHLYNGNRCELFTAPGTPVPFSAFSAKPFMDDLIRPGVDVALGVSHNLSEAADFCALLFGVPVP